MKDFILDMLGLFGVILFVIFLIIIINIPFYFLFQHSCYEKTEDFETRYGFFTGCQIQYDGKWVDWDNYRVVEKQN